MNVVKQYVFNPLRGIINLLLLVIFSVFISFLSYALALIVYPMPFKKLKRKGLQFLYHLPTIWIDLVSLPIKLASFGKLDIQGDPINKDSPNLLISNHQNGLDILILSYVFHRKTPTIKFFAKRELIWTLPIAGLAMWVMGYPFLRRNTRKEALSRSERKSRDIETTHQVCQRMIEYPTTLVNFVEGTRFSEKKRERKNSPYQHLLPAKAGGISTVINEMQRNLGGLIDCTIVYLPPAINFWKFFSGNFTKIICRYQVVPSEQLLLGNYVEDRDYRIQFQGWLNDRWQEKDELIKKIQADATT